MGVPLCFPGARGQRMGGPPSFPACLGTPCLFYSVLSPDWSSDLTVNFTERRELGVFLKIGFSRDRTLDIWGRYRGYGRTSGVASPKFKFEILRRDNHIKGTSRHSEEAKTS